MWESSSNGSFGQYFKKNAENHAENFLQKNERKEPPEPIYRWRGSVSSVGPAESTGVMGCVSNGRPLRGASLFYGQIQRVLRGVRVYDRMDLARWFLPLGQRFVKQIFRDAPRWRFLYNHDAKDTWSNGKFFWPCSKLIKGGFFVKKY